MEMMGIEIMGMHLEIFLMIASGVFYLLCALVVLKSYKQDKNELTGALLAFLVYQAVSMFFMGVEMQTMNMLYSNIASLAVFIGSAYMLKFPLSRFSENTRKVAFRFSLVAVLAIFAWFIQTPEREMELMHFTLWYDLVINGVVVGGSIILLGIRAVEKFRKVKAIGGGTGVVACCVVANTAMLSGAMITSSVFGFLAPIIILSTLGLSKKQNINAPQAGV
jgi:hypothetical protein